MSHVQDRFVMAPARRDSPLTVEKFTEWFGFVTGVVGAITLALNVPLSGYGWYAFLCSNLALAAFAANRRIWSILLMQLVFTTTSVVGIYRWLATDQHHEKREVSCNLTRQAP